MSAADAPPPVNHAVLLAIQPSASSLGPIVSHTPEFLLPLAGKCLGDRILGQLSDLGISHVTILMAGETGRAASFFGDGTRWGISIQLIDVRKSEQVIERLKKLDLDSQYLLGDLYRLPSIDAKLLVDLCKTDAAIVKDDNGRVTGWAVLSSETTAGYDVSEIGDFYTWLDDSLTSVTASGAVLNCLTAKEILSSSTALLNNQVQNQIVSGASGDPGIWIGAGSIIHPTVKIEPPVWIGENCRLEQGVQLGPNVCVSDNCVLGNRSVVKNSCVLPGTCIGNELELEKTVADRNYLAYADFNQTVAVPDSFLLAPNQPIHFAQILGSLIGRLVALFLLLPALPAIAFFWLVGLVCEQHRPLNVERCVKLPAAEDPSLWKTFFLLKWHAENSPLWKAISKSRLVHGLVAIPSIAFGRLHWVGLAPRTVTETHALPDDWRMLYLGCKSGLFQLAKIDQCRMGDSSSEQQYSSEAFYAATRKVRVDMSILLRSLLPCGSHEADSPDNVIVTLTSGEHTLDQLHKFLNEQLHRPDLAVSSDQRDGIITAIHEAVANVIRHAYSYEAGHPVQLHLRKNSEQLEFNIFDKGGLFNPEEIPEPDFSEAARGGFGWFLMNNIADEVVFKRTDDWNRLTMTFERKIP